MRPIAILGGTFDPIHYGHLDIGRAASTSLGLTELLIIPSHIPPHRPPPFASSYHRFAMVALAIAGLGGWRVSDLELRQDARSYTSATLQRLHAAGFTPLELFFVIGADAFADIATWNGYPALLDRTHFAVVSRPGAAAAELPGKLPSLAARMIVGTGATAADAPSIFLIDRPTADVSSTAIRQRRAAGQSIAGLVPPAVQQHIEQHGLYTETRRPVDASEAREDRTAGRLHGEN